MAGGQSSTGPNRRGVNELDDEPFNIMAMEASLMLPGY